MPKIRLAKLNDAYVHKWQAQNRERAVDIREQTLRAAREGTPLTPVMEDQHDFVLTGMRRVFDELTEPSAEYLNQTLIGVTSGSYARGNPIIGSDIDLDIMYPESERSRIYPVERQIIKTTAAILNFPNRGIHPHLSFVLSRLHHEQESRLKPYALEKRLARALMHRHSWVRRKVVAKRSRDFQRWYIKTFLPLERKYAPRDFDLWPIYCLEKLTNENLPGGYDSYFNLGFGFGNQSPLTRLMSRLQQVAQEPEQKPTRLKAAIRSQFFAASLDACETRVCYKYFMEKRAASTRSLRKFIQGKALQHYYDLLKLEELFCVDLLGSSRQEVEEIADGLLKFRAVMEIEGNPLPTIGRSYQEVPWTDDLAARVAKQMQHPSAKSLIEWVLAESKRFTNIIDAAYRTIILD